MKNFAKLCSTLGKSIERNEPISERTIICEDCGGPYETIRSNTKRCATCRLIRDLTYIESRVHTCWLCEREFAPLNRKESLCGSCQYQPRKHGSTACGFCHEDKLRVAADVAVCHDCAREPEHRRTFIKALVKKRLGRQQEYADAA